MAFYNSWTEFSYIYSKIFLILGVVGTHFERNYVAQILETIRLDDSLSISETEN